MSPVKRTSLHSAAIIADRYSGPRRLLAHLALERVRMGYKLRVYGYVVMPDHVHLLLSEPERSSLAEAIKALKQAVSRRLRPCDGRFWQTRYYDFNVGHEEKRVEKLRYIHRNPVKAQLCDSPENWRWSSFLHYATGMKGVVEIESEWTARKRERAKSGNGPMQATAACMGHPE